MLNTRKVIGPSFAGGLTLTLNDSFVGLGFAVIASVPSSGMTFLAVTVFTHEPRYHPAGNADIVFGVDETQVVEYEPFFD